MRLPPASDSVLDAIRNTLLAPLRRVAPSDAARVLFKLEYYNPSGLKYLAGDL
jgi:cysteine synthase